MNWWKQIYTEILRLFGRRPAQLPPASSTTADLSRHAAELPEELQEILRSLAGERGVVVDTVSRALEDFVHLRQVMMGPGAGADAVDDVMLVAEAQELLTAIVVRAPEVKTLLEIATKRADDKAGRSSAGDAILVLRDQGRVLHELASAALQWASSRSEEDHRKLQRCAQRLAS